MWIQMLLVGCLLSCGPTPGTPSEEIQDARTERSDPSPDGLWRPYEGDLQRLAIADKPSGPVSLYELDSLALREVLQRAEEGEPLSSAPRSGGAEITLPMPDGGYASFRIEEASVLAPELRAKYPELRTFRGQGIDDPAATVRLESTPSGFHAHVVSPDLTVFIDPWEGGSLYALRAKKRSGSEDPTGPEERKQ